MSLLSNLLEFSSLSRSNQPIVSKSETKQRSNSLSGYFLSSLRLKQNQNNNSSQKIQQSSLQKCRKSLSKSLSKLNMGQGKIDPKTRNIHRLVQQLNRKCRRHYYTFFVCLETMKKKNVTIQMISMTKQDIQKYENKFNRLRQSYEIILTKLYEKSLKKQFFNGIKTFSKQKQIINNMVNTLQSKNSFIIKKRFFVQLHQIYNDYMRIDILVSAVNSAKQGLQRRVSQSLVDNGQFNQNLEFIHQAFNQIHEFSDKKVLKSQRTNLENQRKYQTPKRNQKYSFSSLQFLEAVELQQKSKLVQQSEFSKIESIAPIRTENFYVKNANHLEFSPQYLNLVQKSEKQKIQRQSPIPISKHISPMNKKLAQFSSIKNNQGSGWKKYKINTQIDQKPMNYQFPQQIKQKSYSKIQPDSLFIKQIGDFYDKIDIFMKMKPKQQQASPSSKGMNQYQQSNVNSVYGMQTIVDKLDKIPDQFNFDLFHGNTHARLHSLNNLTNQQRIKSQIIYGTPGFSHSQSQSNMKNTFDQIDQSEYNQSIKDIHFGSQAVSFKNSLVCQRQSMKKFKQSNNYNNFNANNTQYYPTYGQKQKYSDYNSSSQGFSTYQYQKKKFSQKNDSSDYQTKIRSFDKYINLKTKVNYQEQPSLGSKPGSKSSNNSFKNMITSQEIKTPTNFNFKQKSQQNYDNYIKQENYQQNKNNNNSNSKQFYISSYKYENTYVDPFPRNSHSATGNYQIFNSNKANKHHNGYLDPPIKSRFDDGFSSSINPSGKVKNQFYRNTKKIDLNLNSLIPSNDQIKIQSSSQWMPQLQINNYSSTKPATPRDNNGKIRSISFTDNKINSKRNSFNNEIYDKIEKLDKDFPQHFKFENCMIGNIGNSHSPLRQNLERPVRDVHTSSQDKQIKRPSMKTGTQKLQKQAWGNPRQGNQFIKLRSRRQSMK